MKKVVSIFFLFMGIFLLNLIGAMVFYIEKDSDLYRLILVSLAGFITGYLICAPRKRLKIRLSQNRLLVHHNTRVDFWVIWALFLLFFVFGFSLFVQRGIPLFHANDNALRSSFGIGTKGRIRAVVVWIPMAALAMYCLYLKTKKYKWSAYVMVALALMNLMFYSFKSNILWLFVMLFYVNYYLNRQLDLKKLFLFFTAGFILMILVFSIWLSSGTGTAFSYLIKRMTADQVDGLNYVFNTYVKQFGFEGGQHFVRELKSVFMTKTTGVSFDLKLAELFYGRKVTWGIVLTLYGFLFVDFSYGWAFLGFTILGVSVKFLHIYLLRGDQLSIQGFISGIFSIVLLCKIFLVGNVFNELRGMLVSILFFRCLYSITYLLFEVRYRKLLKVSTEKKESQYVIS